MSTKNSIIRISTGLDATLPASVLAQKGRLKYSTDTQTFYIDDGSTNVKVGGWGWLNQSGNKGNSIANIIARTIDTNQVTASAIAADYIRSTTSSPNITFESDIDMQDLAIRNAELDTVDLTGTNTISGQLGFTGAPMQNVVLGTSATGVIVAQNTTSWMMARSNVASGQSLNSITQVGMYAITGAISPTVLMLPNDFPAGGGALLKVSQDGSGYVTQEITLINPNANDPYNYKRTRTRNSTGLWGVWGIDYIKAATGIPQSDLDAATQAKLNMIAPATAVARSEITFSFNTTGGTWPAWFKLGSFSGSGMTQSTINCKLFSAWSQINDFEFTCGVQSQYNVGNLLLATGVATARNGSRARFSYPNQVQFMLCTKAWTAETELWIRLDVTNFSLFFEMLIVSNGVANFTPLSSADRTASRRATPPSLAEGWLYACPIISSAAIPTTGVLTDIPNFAFVSNPN